MGGSRPRYGWGDILGRGIHLLPNLLQQLLLLPVAFGLADKLAQELFNCSGQGGELRGIGVDGLGEVVDRLGDS